jgi:flagellar biosynthesis component FlhA
LDRAGSTGPITSLGQAAKLRAGDALISQIPALLSCGSAGTIVT